MNLLKIITAVFVVYYIRRFIQLYRYMQERQVQENNQANSHPKTPDAIEAEFIKIDPK